MTSTWKASAINPIALYQVNDPWSKIDLFKASNEVVAAVWSFLQYLSISFFWQQNIKTLNWIEYSHWQSNTCPKGLSKCREKILCVCQLHWCWILLWLRLLWGQQYQKNMLQSNFWNTLATYFTEMPKKPPQ